MAKQYMGRSTRGRRTITPIAAGGGAGTTFRGPKIAALDYRTSGAGSWDSTLHAKYDISIMGTLPTTGNVATAVSFINAAKAINPNWRFFTYTIATQLPSNQDGYTAYQAISDKLDETTAGGGKNYWANDAATGQKTKTPSVLQYDACEVNISTYTAVNTSGNRAAEEIAIFFSNVYANLFAAGASGFFQDNVWGGPGSSGTGFSKRYVLGQAVYPTYPGTNLSVTGTCGDYDLNGSNDSLGLFTVPNRAVSPAPGFRQGQANYVTKLKSLRPGILVIANADCDTINDPNYGESCLSSSEMTGVWDFAFWEGALGKNYSFETYRNLFADTYRRYTSSENSLTGAGGVIVGSYVDTLSSLGQKLQMARATVAFAMLRDGYAAVSSGTLGPYWFNEIDPAFMPIGTAVGAKPSAATSNGIWSRTYQNGIVLYNPPSNRGRMLNTSTGSFISRTGGVLTVCCPALKTVLVAGEKLRIMKAPNLSFDTSFEGTVTLLTVNSSTGVMTANQAGADVAQVNLPGCFIGGKATIDLTGQGYKRFLGTDDAHNDYDNGTSMNDGGLATVETLWAGDGRLLLSV